MFDITVIIEAVFALLAAIITAIVIPYIKSKTTASQQAEDRRHRCRADLHRLRQGRGEESLCAELAPGAWHYR